MVETATMYSMILGVKGLRSRETEATFLKIFETLATYLRFQEDFSTVYKIVTTQFVITMHHHLLHISNLSIIINLYVHQNQNKLFDNRY